MNNVKELIKHPSTDNGMKQIFICGLGVYNWNSVWKQYDYAEHKPIPPKHDGLILKHNHLKDIVWDKTVVIFRKFKKGDVIAIFPEQLGTNDYYCTCGSYMRIGQHSACTPNFLVQETKPATYEEYESLMQELKNIGYWLDIKKRMSSKYLETRKTQLENIEKYN